MNILHIIFSFNNGGSENLIVDLLNNWNGQDKVYLCIVNNFYDQLLLNKIKAKNVEIIKLNRKPGSSRFTGMKELRRIVREKRIDIIHCHSTSVFEYAFLALGFPIRFKYVLTIHNMTVYTTMNKTRVLFHRIFLHKITAISEAVKESICKQGFPARKITVIYNGIDLTKYKRKIWNGTAKQIICIGRMIPKIKGQDILIQAMKKVHEVYPEIICVFVGGDPEGENNIEIMKKLSKDFNLEGVIKFVGNCHNVPKLLAESDLQVVPSREEGFGLVVVEGMATGLPVICSYTGGPIEIIQDNINGYFFEVENANDLAKKIIKVLSSPQKRIIENAYKMVKDRFDIITTVTMMREVYQ